MKRPKVATNWIQGINFLSANYDPYKTKSEQSSKFEPRQLNPQSIFIIAENAGKEDLTVRF
jgi:hypothetical protein